MLLKPEGQGDRVLALPQIGAGCNNSMQFNCYTGADQIHSGAIVKVVLLHLIQLVPIHAGTCMVSRTFSN